MIPFGRLNCHVWASWYWNYEVWNHVEGISASFWTNAYFASVWVPQKNLKHQLNGD